MSEARERVFHIRLNEEDTEILENLTELYGYRYASDLIRVMIRYIRRKTPTMGETVKPVRKESTHA